jgi:6,7-dimethyl-8-ribityllumazine synthase
MSTADSPRPVAPKLAGPAPRVLIISAPYYHHVVDGMQSAALAIFAQAKALSEIVEVSGAFELPQALALAAEKPDAYDGYIVLGCVVRGETDHYEFICNSTMNGLIQVATAKHLCLGSAVLTVDTLAQAVARSHETGANKGAEAAVACLRQIGLKRRFAA